VPHETQPELEFAVDLSDVRDRLAALRYFNGVTDIEDATNVIETLSALPPWAFVSVASETAEANRIAAGGHSQRVTVDVSVLFCVPAESRAEDTGDVVERTRRAVIRILLAWTPKGAESPFNYSRYLLRATGDGLVWGEVIMRTRYRLTAA